MQKVLEELILGLFSGVKPSRSRPSAGRYRHTAVSAVRAKGPIVLAKGQNGTFGIQTHPLHLGLFIFFLSLLLQGFSPAIYGLANSVLQAAGTFVIRY